MLNATGKPLHCRPRTPVTRLRPSRSSRPGSRVTQSRLRAEAAEQGRPVSLAQAAALASKRPVAKRRWTFHLVAWLATLTALAGWYQFGPTSRTPTHLTLLAASLAASSGLAWLAFRLRPRVGVRASALTCAAAAVLAALMVVGGQHSVVVDGRVQASTSSLARIDREVRAIQSDLVEIASYDVLLRLDVATARGRLDEYERAAVRLEELAAHYGEKGAGELPAEELRPVIGQVKVAAAFGSQALVGYRNLVLQYDARLDANVTSWHIAYTEAALMSGSGLADVAGLHGLLLVDPSRDPVE
jgi:hypothetical protein